VTRPDQENKCPEGMKPCIATNTNPSNTLCYPQDKHEESCPITDIKIVNKADVGKYTSK